VQQGLQLRATLAGQPELPGKSTVPGGPQPEEPAVLLQLLIGERAVRVDSIHDLVRQPAQLLRGELGGEPGQQLLPGVDSLGVEPAPSQRGQRPHH
jgi:hypothetical protein